MNLMKSKLRAWPCLHVFDFFGNILVKLHFGSSWLMNIVFVCVCCFLVCFSVELN